MINTITMVLLALGFGLGVSLSFYGFLLLHQMYIGNLKFNSQMIMSQIALAVMTVGLTLLFIVWQMV